VSHIAQRTLRPAPPGEPCRSCAVDAFTIFLETGRAICPGSWLDGHMERGSKVASGIARLIALKEALRVVRCHLAIAKDLVEESGTEGLA
jgi:hypothetical protein